MNGKYYYLEQMSMFILVAYNNAAVATPKGSSWKNK